MKLPNKNENSVTLATVVNTIIMLLVNLDEMFAEDAFSKSSGSGNTSYDFEYQKGDDLKHTNSNNSSKEKNERIHDKYFKVVDLFHEDPDINLVSSIEKISYQNSKCDYDSKMRKYDHSNVHKLYSLNQVDTITTNDYYFTSNLYSKNETASGSSMQGKTNASPDDAINTLNNQKVNTQTCVGKCNKLQNNEAHKLFKTHNKEVEVITHFIPLNLQFSTKLTDKIAKTKNESEKVLRKIRQLGLSDFTITFNNNRNKKTLYQTNPNNLLKFPTDVANENLEIVMDESKDHDNMKNISYSNQKFYLNDDKSIPLDEKKPANNYYESTRSAQSNESATRTKLKNSRSPSNYKIKKYYDNDFPKKQKIIKSTISGMKNMNINESNNIMNESVIKMQNYYEPIKYRTKSPRARHKLPYAKIMDFKALDNINKNTEVFTLFNSSHLNQKLNNIDDMKQITLKPLNAVYRRMGDKSLSNAKNQIDSTTQGFLGYIDFSRRSDNTEDDGAEDDDDDDDPITTASDNYALGIYNSYNKNHNQNDNRYEHFSEAITNENNVNNVIVINFRTTRYVPTVFSLRTCPPPPGAPITGPTYTFIRDEFVMDQNIFMAVLFTSMFILVILSCCCAPFMLIKKNKESRNTQALEGITDYSYCGSSETF